MRYVQFKKLLAAQAGMSQLQTHQFMMALVKCIHKALEEGEEVPLPRLGVARAKPHYGRVRPRFDFYRGYKDRFKSMFVEAQDDDADSTG